jgi:cysteine-rich repeat protein
VPRDGASVCGNGELGSSEECDDGNLLPDDGCAPDCTLECGDGRVSGAEDCDVGLPEGTPGACPTTCDDGEVCTADLLSGSDCDVTCSNTAITEPADGDLCCPSGADAASDDDCAGSCGDGLRTGDEACDTGIAVGNPGACLDSCDDGVACTMDVLAGAATCAAACTYSPISTAANGDGCCPSGATIGSDDDCAPACGDGVLSSGELCDTSLLSGVGRCPTSCDDGLACTADALVDAGTCAARCTTSPITAPANGDGCCPSGATTATDSDCSPACGDGVVQSGERCDTAITSGPGRCPTACDDGMACTSDVLTGSGTCAAMCTSSPITALVSGDGCCPSGGTIATDGDCAARCGDGVVSAPESCDTSNLAGATCVSRGFTAGTLACSACAFDASGCTTCGNGVREGAEVCDGSDVGAASCVSSGFRSGTLGCGASCGALDTSLCSLGAVPTAGQIVITEIMPDPATIPDADGEWFEVTNTASIPLELRGCVFSDNQTVPTAFTVGTSLIIPPGGYATFARSVLAGFAATYLYPAWPLINGDDEVRLTCAGNLIDSVLYTTPAAWRFASGRSTSLSPSVTNATANDTAANWCPGVGVYEATGPNRGTPGVANPACEICNNGADDDGDGSSDCGDSDCASNPACVVATPGLLFSEYVEGSADNKALEVWNNTGTARNLTGCGVRLYANGNSVATATYTFNTTLAAGDVFVLCNGLSTTLPTAVCDATSGVTNFNGDDAIELFCGETTMDVIGQIGGSPPGGSGGWTSSGVSTLNATLRPICPGNPDTNGSDAFSPSARWRSFPVDTFSGLGTGSCAP